MSTACQRLGLPAPVEGKAQLFSAEASGLLVQLPDWTYPAVIDVQTGEVHYDTFEGAWGNEAHLQRFLQIYAIELVKLEARKKGFNVTEQAVQDGAIKLQIIEGGS